MIGWNEPREPARDGAEQDVIGSWRHRLCYTCRPGVASKIKRQIRRRERHKAKAEMRAPLDH